MIGGTMRVLPLTVLYHEGPMARAYLAAMRACGLRPQRLIRLVTLPPTGLLRVLPGSLGRTVRAQLQHQRMSHWPRWLLRTCPGLVNAMAGAVRERLGLPVDAVEVVTGALADREHAEEVEVMDVPGGYADPALARRLVGAGTVLFTGGGLVPAALLAQDGLRLLHIHPGVLPEIRGADGLLWSLLVRGRPGASCLFLDAGIDTGPVVAARDLPHVRFPVADAARPDDKSLYRALYSFWDPFLRARLLVDVLHDTPDLAALVPPPQDAAAGTVFHFMNPALRKKVLADLFE